VSTQPPDYTELFELDGTPVTVRSMRPEDREIEDRFVRELSPDSRYLRFHAALRQLSPGMLERFTHPDYPSEMALIATIAEGGGERQIGVARYHRVPATDCAEVAVVVADDWQGKGLATRLLLRLREIALGNGIMHFEATVLPRNQRMLALARQLGFTRSPQQHSALAVELGKELENPEDPDSGEG
jgi:acetyltransferase